MEVFHVFSFIAKLSIYSFHSVLFGEGGGVTISYDQVMDAVVGHNCELWGGISQKPVP